MGRKNFVKVTRLHIHQGTGKTYRRSPSKTVAEIFTSVRPYAA